MERYAFPLLFEAHLNVHNARMTELEQWKVKLPNFHLHEQITILSEIFWLLLQSIRERKLIT